MKKVILLILLVVFTFILSSCGNRQVGIDVNQSFNKAYINLGGEWKLISVRSWRDFEDGDEVQVISNDGTVYLSHYCNMTLVNEK